MSKSRHKWWQPKVRLHVEPLVRRVLEGLDTPVSLGVYLRLKYGEHKQIAEMSINPQEYTCAEDYFRDAQAIALLSKNQILKTGIDTRAEALKKFIQSEISCLETNDRYFRRNEGEGFHFPPSVNAILHSASRKIAAILGDAPSFADMKFHFGPGASFGVRKETSVYNKVSSDPECTFALLPCLQEFIAEFPGWFSDENTTFTIRRGSELTVVPKNAKTDRPICIEPLVNGFIQGGIGSYMRDRLRRWGVNLKDQGVNQKLASEAYVKRLATVDFSSASDTISYAVVHDLLPEDWFELLDMARSPCYLIEDLWYPFHKFSSMGNGYTFELESLIFYAVAFATVEYLGIPVQTGKNLSVYGDDVIIPAQAFYLFQEVCSHMGFSINSEKSYHSGPFNESCGADYYLGTDVRPYFLKKEIVSLTEMYHAANTVLRIAGKVQGFLENQVLPSGLGTVLGSLRSCHAWSIGCIPKRFRLLVPDGAGDAGLVADFDVAVPQPSRNEGWEGWFYHAIVEQAALLQPRGETFPMAYALYHAGLGSPDLPSVRKVGRGLLVGQDFLMGIRPRDLVIPEALEKGKGYTVRHRTRFRKVKSFWNGHWPLAPCIWGLEAVSLV